MEMQQEFIHKNEENKKFVCQCIVNTGSNNDPVEKNGISHIIEHFLIHYSKKNRFFRNIMIHGFTGFYYTNYYWYVNDIKEAIESYSEFEKIVFKSIICSEDKELFEGIKKDIEKEIIFFKEKTDNVARVVSTLFDKNSKILLPIGKVNDVRKIKYKDMVEYLGKYYTLPNIHKFLFDKSNQIFYVEKKNVEKLQISSVTETEYIGAVQTYREAFKGIHVSFLNFNYLIEANVIKFIYKNIFINTLTEIIVGEIFMMQICDYIKKIMGDNVEIGYQKIFISKDKIYFVLTIQNMNTEDYESILQRKQLELYDILQDILEESGFKRIKSFMLNYLIEHDITNIKMNEIMADLINYSTLSYDSYNIIGDKEGVITFIGNLEYNQYCGCVYEMLMRMGEENVRLLHY